MNTINHSEFFTRNELKCKCGCDTCEMDEDFMQMLDIIRFRIGKPIILNSAYRCCIHNENQGGVKDSPHVLGLAVDVKCSGHEAYDILTEAIALEIKGVGISQKGSHESRFIHLDNQHTNSKGTRPWVWSY